MQAKEPIIDPQRVVRGADLYPVFVDQNKCNGCRRCLSRCTTGAITINAKGKAVVAESSCLGLGGCIAVCREHAIRWKAS